MIYFILFLFVVGFIVYMSSRHTLSNEMRNSLSPHEIEMIDEELKNRKYIGQIILIVACSITVVYMG